MNSRAKKGKENKKKRDSGDVRALPTLGEKAKGGKTQANNSQG